MSTTAANIATSQPTGVEAYEDMFKEITRKLYGEETGHGLHTLGTPVAHVATGGPTAPEGERSFTTLISERSLTTIDYDHVGSESNNPFKSDEHLTAFGLAALMQNGFPPHSAILNPHTFAPKHQQQQQLPTQQSNLHAGPGTSTAPTTTTGSSNPSAGNNIEEKWTASAEECGTWSGATATKTTPQKHFKKRHESAHQKESGNNTNNQQQQAVNNTAVTIPKRYNCSNCPYSTDRRDLFTRHENIHKEEKPFHCYVCLKQFNRADHVKKHFLRMHRGLIYDISRTKKATTQNRKPGNFFVPPEQQHHQNLEPVTLPGNTYQPSVHDQSNSTNNAGTAGSSTDIPPNHHPIKTEKGEKTVIKKEREKRFVCCYCPWSGTDNWGLKRHLNTHTKPYVCMLCDYKAARSERLSTHVFKVHNKKICNKCNFLADNQEEYQTHVNEVHAHDTRPQRTAVKTEPPSNVLRTIGNSFNLPINQIQSPSVGHVFGNSTSNLQSTNVTIYGSSTNNNMTESILSNQNLNNWRNVSSVIENSNPNQKHGAERLFQYMEAEGSDPEDYNRLMQMIALSRNTASVAQDFHNAGDEVKSNFIIWKKQMQYQNQHMLQNHKCLLNNRKSKKHLVTNSQLTCPDVKILQPSHISSPAQISSLYTRTQEHQAEKTQCTKLNAKENNFPTPLKLVLNTQVYLYSSPEQKNKKVYYMQPSSFNPLISSSHQINVENNDCIIKIPPDLTSNQEPTDNCLSKFETIRNNDFHKPQEHELSERDRKTQVHAAIKTKEYKRSHRKFIEAIRDKHLMRMVSSKKHCTTCRSIDFSRRKSRNKCNMLTMPYHTVKTLLLHQLWRHNRQKFKCIVCNITFDSYYKHILHFKLNVTHF